LLQPARPAPRAALPWKNTRLSLTHKKVVSIVASTAALLRGYLIRAQDLRAEAIDPAHSRRRTSHGSSKDVRSIYFVREFTDDFEPERKALSVAAKAGGPLVRLKFRDNDCIEAWVPTDLLSLLDRGVQLRRRTFMDNAADFYSTHVAHGDERFSARWHRTAKPGRDRSAGPFQRVTSHHPVPNFRAMQECCRVMRPICGDF